MAVNTAQVSGRRKLHFADFSQLLADVDYVATHPCHTLGNWSVGQILDHLAVAANSPFDGYDGYQASWFTRHLIVPFIKNNLLTKPMAAGFQIPKDATVMFPATDTTPQAGYKRLKDALARFSNELPKYPHPILGDLAFQEWVAVTLRHAELHLSFIVPAEVPAACS